MKQAVSNKAECWVRRVFWCGFSFGGVWVVGFAWFMFVFSANLISLYQTVTVIRIFI